MEKTKFDRLIDRGVLTQDELAILCGEAKRSHQRLEDLLLAEGAPKHELLFCLSAYYGYPFVEYDESVVISQQIIRQMDMERLKQSLWVPLSVRGEQAEVIASHPYDPAVIEDIRATLKVTSIDFKIALPGDLIRIIEHNQDLNPKFPPAAGRTPLAKVRTFLAEQRSRFVCHRTTLARSRTGLALLRTGLSFMAIGLVLFRIFGHGLTTVVIEALLFVTGLAAAVDGLVWYLPARSVGRKSISCAATTPTGGTTVLAASQPGDDPVFLRLTQVEKAEELRKDWSRLSPVMRRRFLANDRTDLAEERTVLACHRTLMARARTGLSFTRTGIAFIGLGVALLRQFSLSRWTSLDAAIIVLGAVMFAEGFYWYLPGRKAGLDGADAVTSAENRRSIWDGFFNFLRQDSGVPEVRSTVPPVRGYHSPGIWATTGLALERTLLAERRNVMARLRTIMARSRTGMAFIRTGISLAAVGLGLLIYFGAGSMVWTAVEAGMVLAGLLVIADGLSWYLPAERTRRQFPYCFGDMEITVPDYGRPTRTWRKAVFSHDDI